MLEPWKYFTHITSLNHIATLSGKYYYHLHDTEAQNGFITVYIHKANKIMEWKLEPRLISENRLPINTSKSHLIFDQKWNILIDLPSCFPDLALNDFWFYQ